MSETFTKSIASLTVDELRQLCILNKISGMSNSKKTVLTDALNNNYTKKCTMLKKLKVSELEEMCRLKKIKGFSVCKKDELVDLITLFDMSIDVKEFISVPEPGEDKDIIELDEQMQQLEKARLELEQKVEQVKKAKLKVEQERLEKEQLERERVEREQLERERVEQERVEQERVEREQLEKERVEREQLERLKSISEQSSIVDETTGVKKERKKKEAIPKSVRSHVWNLYIGPTINEHRCLCCKKTVIKITEFDCGHVIAESVGGTHEIGNLRPICSACNHAMGSQNMIEFVVKYGYYIG